MAVLTKKEILKEIKKGRVKIEPFSPSQVGPSSIDLHLDNQFRILRASKKIHHITENSNYEKLTKVVKVKDYIVLKPGETINGITKEKITLPNNICGWLEGRSRFARLGLMVHITAGLIHPGVSNKQVLEMSNMGPVPLALHPGTKICQLVLERTIGKAKYNGKFANQNSV